MAHDRDYFLRRTAEARAAAFAKDEGEGVEIAGQLALAYGALARRRVEATPPPDGDEPLMLRDYSHPLRRASQ